MPRPLRLQLEKAVYFVTQEGPYQGNIFGDREDYEKYLQLLSRSKQTGGLKLFAYALLPNQIYLLIEMSDPKASLSCVMQQLTLRYTQYFNHRYERKGPLFRRRFRSVVVEKKEHLAPLTRYIHLEPLRSGIVENLEAHPYTSYEAFTRIGTDQNSSFPNLNEEIQEVLGSVPDKPLGNSYEHYALSADEGELKELDQKLSRGLFVLGSEEFVAAARKRLEETRPRETVSSLKLWKAPFALSGIFGLCLAVAGFVFFAAATLSGTSVTPVFKMEGMKLTGPMDEIKRLLSEAANLDGTVWDVELIQTSAEGQKQRIKDQIRFNGANFESYYFSSQGFASSNYTVTVHQDGTITWQAVQKNSKGEVVRWRGDWQGEKMIGNLSYHRADAGPQGFSFMSQPMGAQNG